MTGSLVQKRCQHHASREAAARCPECKRFFCRECISEYEDRVLCTNCLAKLTAPSVKKKNRLESLILLAQSMVGVLLIWFFFLLMGQVLLAVPARFHEGRVWQQEEGAE